MTANHPYSKTINRFGPWTPMTSVCSMSAVLLGPLTRVMLAGIDVRWRDATQVKMSGVKSEVETRAMCTGGSRVDNRLRPAPLSITTEPVATRAALVPDGAVWFGGINGISRFDGQNWRTYHTNDGLIESHGYSLAIETDGTVWVGTENGVSFSGSMK